MAGGKELNFFTGPEWNWRLGLDWYEQQFPTDAPVRGETSHTYSNHPFAQGVPERIRSTLGDVKLLYIVGDPIVRVISDWVGEYSNGHEARSFDELMQAPELERTGYLARSQYAHQLSVYLEVFPKSAIEVVCREDLASSPHEEMARIFRFLGVNHEFSSPSFEEVHNPSAPKRRDRRAARHLRRVPGLRRVERKGIVTQGIGGRLMTAPFSTTVRRPIPTNAQRDRLSACLAPDAQRLRQMTGKRFPAWSV